VWIIGWEDTDEEQEAEKPQPEAKK
jgi:hypothetical protein